MLGIAGEVEGVSAHDILVPGLLEAVVEESLLATEASAAGTLPSLYVSGVAVAEQGAWPLGCQDLYDADDAELGRYATAARTEAGFREWLDGFVAGRARAA